jgi:DNA repair photolyase
VIVLTKSALVLRDLDILSGHNARIGVTVTTLDERLRALWEPGGSSVGERLRVIEAAHRGGLETAIMFGPLLPFLSDGQACIDALFQRAADLAIDVIWVDALNVRPRVWPAVAALLREKFPGLHEPYRRLLFEARARESYLAQLRRRVADAAPRFSLQDRITVCF